MPNIREAATKCMWLAATALTGCLGLAIGVLLTPLYLLILYPVALYFAHKQAAEGGPDPTPLHIITLRRSCLMNLRTCLCSWLCSWWLSWLYSWPYSWPCYQPGG